MILEFLEKYEEELFSDRIELKDNLDLVRSEIREDEKFIQMLESETEDLFTDFSPRDNLSKNADKIEELQNGLQKKMEEQKKLDNRIAFTDARLDEVHELISYVKSQQNAGVIAEVESDTITKVIGNEMADDQSETFDNRNPEEMNENLVREEGDFSHETDSYKVDVPVRKADLIKIKNFLPADPIRAIVELQDLIKKF